MTPSAPTRAAVVGTGFIAVQHVDALRRIPGAEPRLIVGSSEGRGRDAARRLGIERWSGDYAAAVADPEIDIVHVCVPNHLHLPVTEAALAARKHVISEKPLALDAAQAERLVGLAESSDRATFLCHNYRFYPMIAELRSRIRSGDLGPLHLVRGHYLQDWLLLASDHNWRVDPERGGRSRAIADIGSHWVDLAETVTGGRLASVMAELTTVHPRRVAGGARTFESPQNDAQERRWEHVPTEDQASLLLRFNGGLHGALTVSQVAAGHKNDLELSIDGADGSATWRQEDPDMLLIGHRGRADERLQRGDGGAPEAASLARLPAGHNEGWADGLRNLLGAIYSVIRGEVLREDLPVPLPTFADGLRHHRFVEAALRSASEERWIPVDEIPAIETVPAILEASA